MIDDHNNENQIHHQHDTGYKYLLSSKKIFMELLRNFVKKGWVNKIDESAMIRVDKSYILQDFNKKEADFVYRLKIKDQDVIFYILMELQSSVDFQMPYRLLLYMVEIWRDILIDVNRYKKRDLIKLSNTISSIFLLDQEYDIIEIEERFKAVCNVMRHLEPDQFQLLTTWIDKIILSSVSNEILDNIAEIIDSSFNSKEVDDMVSNFARTLKKMQEQSKVEGANQNSQQIAIEMLKRNVSEKFIAEVTRLPLSQLIRLKRELD
ncbi:MAG: Rpn family recombination-promoting nuclease/putative transposase [Halanaerobiales bacterium]|nr:Rpn family recombination-promoting nuclease/putative transposase [Halanaerobiales bacterium]